MATAVSVRCPCGYSWYVYDVELTPLCRCWMCGRIWTISLGDIRVTPVLPTRARLDPSAESQVA